MNKSKTQDIQNDRQISASKYTKATSEMFDL